MPKFKLTSGKGDVKPPLGNCPPPPKRIRGGAILIDTALEIAFQARHRKLFFNDNTNINRSRSSADPIYITHTTPKVQLPDTATDQYMTR